MKAAQLTEYRDESSIQFTRDASNPAAGEGEVLVAVQAAGVNPFDWKVRDGSYKDFIPLQLPAILGGDFSGTIAAVGANVTNFEVGEEVYGMANAVSGHGSFAEFTPVKATQIMSKPISVDFVSAAALPLAAISAYQALVDHMSLSRGQKILIHGGAGGIGSLAIQIAHHIGTSVATTVNITDSDFVKSLGAETVIDYKNQDFATLLHNYDAVFDTVGGETNTKSYTVLKPGGALVSMVQPVDETLVKKYAIVYTQQSSQPTIERLNKITELVDDGSLKVIVDKVFPLEQAAAALQYLKVGHPKGKVVIQVATEQTG